MQTIEITKLNEKTKPLTQYLREARRTMRIACSVAIFAVTHAALFPHLAAAQAAIAEEEKANEIVLQGSPEQQLNQALLKVQEIADAKQRTIAERLENESGLLDSLLNFFGLSQLQLEEVDNLEQLNALLAGLNQTAMAQFAETERQLIDKQLPEAIQQRHRETVANYQQQFTDLSLRLAEVLQADNLRSQGEAINALDHLMAPQKLKRQHQKTDPNNLPWGTPDAEKTRKPAKTAEELSRLTGISPDKQGTLLAANTLPPLGQPGGPVAEDLAQTPDIEITEAIRTLAEDELNDNPVAIYNWVRNNIEYIPSYGSIQGADYTLQHRRGNAFDTASLLIALFRASNIPARYAYGTIEVPVEKVMNWVGGVEVPEAAQQLLGQGGIPNEGQIHGGRMTHIQMEHVWVEAWVDYFPSRGAKHEFGDQWLPLDPSFKQYDFTQGQDIESNVPFDAQGLVDDITQTASIDEAAGFVQGIDQTAIETALTNYQQQIEDYINTQNPDATVGDILGIQRIIVQEYQQLAAGLPYTLTARTNNYAELPNELRHRFRYTLSTEVAGREGNRLISFEQSLPELAGKKHTLSFRPTEQADEDLINSFIPQPDPVTGEIDPTQLPNSLPGYLINLTAEFAQDGVIIEEAVTGNMGEPLYETLGMWSPAMGWNQAVNHPIAGEYRAIGLDLQGVNPEEAVQLQEQIEVTQAILNGRDEAQMESLTRNELVGDFLYSVIFGYLVINDIQDQLQSKSAGVIHYRLPSFGLLNTKLLPRYFFGIPRSIHFSGLTMDVDKLSLQSVAKDNNRLSKIDFIISSGIRSSVMEHAVPEQMLSVTPNSVQAVSSIKALSLANTEGQRIWTISINNLDEALSVIDHSIGIENQIRNAVRMGKEVIIHQRPIDFFGKSNVGYILIDMDTGAGAYLISSGDSGADIDFFDPVDNPLNSALSSIISLLGLGAGVLDLLFGGGPFAAIGTIVAYLSGALVVLGALTNCSLRDTLVALVPLLLAVVFTLIIGVGGLALVLPLRFALSHLFHFLAGKAVALLVEDRCE